MLPDCTSPAPAVAENLCLEVGWNILGLPTAWLYSQQQTPQRSRGLPPCRVLPTCHLPTSYTHTFYTHSLGGDTTKDLGTFKPLVEKPLWEELSESPSVTENLWMMGLMLVKERQHRYLIRRVLPSPSCLLFLPLPPPSFPFFPVPSFLFLSSFPLLPSPSALFLPFPSISFPSFQLERRRYEAKNMLCPLDGCSVNSLVAQSVKTLPAVQEAWV